MSLHLSARERWLTTTLLGLGLIIFAIDASNTQLILPSSVLVLSGLLTIMPPVLLLQA